MTKQPQSDTDSGLVQATKRLGAAMDNYRKVAEVARIAASQCEEALADLNACQIAVDVAIEEMRKGAPEASRWNQPANQPPPEWRKP